VRFLLYYLFRVQTNGCKFCLQSDLIGLTFGILPHRAITSICTYYSLFSVRSMEMESSTVLCGFFYLSIIVIMVM